MTKGAGTYSDPGLPPERRAGLLLAQMTLEEKIGQMCQYVGEASAQRADNADEVVGYTLALGDKAALVRQGRVGSFLKVPGAREANALQELAEASRLGIPLLIATDAIHGHGMDVQAATIFPSPIGMAAAFDPALVERIAACTARELRATGFHWTFSPNVDVVRDPRWGRTGETFGEDPWLVGELGAAMVRGYQGGSWGSESVLACAKHLVAGGVPDNGLNGAPAELSERSLREHFYPPFVKAVEAGVYTLMPSHNEVNGVPCHADRHLLTELLRDEWGFVGFVISDWLDIARLHGVHRVAETRKDADALAVLAGIDMHMHGGEFFENVRDLVLEGRIPMQRIDAAVQAILLAKLRLGLFERRYSNAEQSAATLLAPAHRDLALEASRKSLVLLENRGSLLPLGAGVGSVLVTGPNADDQSLLGDWARQQPAANVVTVLSGIRALAPASTRVDHAPVGSIALMSEEEIEAAASAAARADVIIAVVGESSLRDNPARTSGENVDRASLDLPGRQPALLERLAATGKPLVVVLINGAPLGSERLVAQAAALLEAWEPGMMGGTAVAEVLFGLYNPSGRLPISVPRSVGHVRSYYNQRPSAYHRGKFRFYASEPLFGFGHGLSYTTFTYRELRARDSIAPGERLTVEVVLENTGARAGEEVVLLFVQDLYATVTRPIKELKAFRRVRLEPGERTTVSLELEAEAFSLLTTDWKKSIEPGEFRLSVGREELERSVWVK